MSSTAPTPAILWGGTLIYLSIARLAETHHSSDSVTCRPHSALDIASTAHPQFLIRRPAAAARTQRPSAHAALTQTLTLAPALTPTKTLVGGLRARLGGARARRQPAAAPCARAWCTGCPAPSPSGCSGGGARGRDCRSALRLAARLELYNVC